MTARSDTWPPPPVRTVEQQIAMLLGGSGPTHPDRPNASRAVAPVRTVEEQLAALGFKPGDEINAHPKPAG